MKQIKAKYQLRCTESNRIIKKGEEMIFDPDTGKCYSILSDTACYFIYKQAGYDYLPPGVYVDNYCWENNI